MLARMKDFQQSYVEWSNKYNLGDASQQVATSDMAFLDVADFIASDHQIQGIIREAIEIEQWEREQEKVKDAITDEAIMFLRIYEGLNREDREYSRARRVLKDFFGKAEVGDEIEKFLRAMKWVEQQEYLVGPLKNKRLADEIERFLAERWKRIANTPLCYTLNTYNQLNQFCLQLAMLLDSEKPFTYLLPGVAEEDVYTTSLHELKLGQFIITDEKDKFIDIAGLYAESVDRLSSVDASLFTTIGSDGQERNLSKEEIRRLKSDGLNAMNKVLDIQAASQRSSQGVLQRLFSRAQTNLYDELVALRRALRRADAAHLGKEMLAAASSNAALVRFSEYYYSLPQAKRDELNKLESGSYKLGEELEKLFRSTDVYKKADGTGIRFCIQLIGGHIETIISANKDALQGVSVGWRDQAVALHEQLDQYYASRTHCMPSQELIPSLHDQGLMCFKQIASSLKGCSSEYSGQFLNQATFVINQCMRKMANGSIDDKLQAYFNLLLAIGRTAHDFPKLDPVEQSLMVAEIAKRIHLLSGVHTKAGWRILGTASQREWEGFMKDKDGLQRAHAVSAHESVDSLEKYSQLFPGFFQRRIRSELLESYRVSRSSGSKHSPKK